MKSNSQEKIKILISGYYGCANAGDEAVLAGIFETFNLLKIDADIIVLTSDIEDTKDKYPNANCVNKFSILKVIKEIKNSDIVISGGGSLLQDVTSKKSLQYYLLILRIAQFFKKKTMIYAQGIGPLKDASSRKSVAKVLKRVDEITVRDQDSKNLLISLGILPSKIEIVCDPAVLIEPDLHVSNIILKDLNAGNETLIGVSLRPWHNQEKWLNELAEGIKNACKKLHAKPIIISMQPEIDLQLSKAFDDAIILPNIYDVKVLKGIISNCKLIVGMRLHSLIFAASERVPFVPISYDPKVNSFSETIGKKDIIDLENINSDDVCEKIIEEYSKREESFSILSKKSSEMRAQAIYAGTCLKELIDK
ncbi:MAG: polysaccharide pyruvyl transferase CsaB [Armatimonadota bacterium]